MSGHKSPRANDNVILLAMPIMLLLVPVCSTLLGGLLAVRYRRWIHVLLALGAGLLLGAAFFDLLPEALLIGLPAGVPVTKTLALTLVSFLSFFALENLLESFSSGRNAIVPRRSAGRIAGTMLIFHSVRDGMAIGAAFLASHTAGYAVAIGIAAHDLGDGMNTVLLTTAGEAPLPIDYAFLLADALAPFVGGLIALRWFSSVTSSVVLLAIAAGFFLQMAAGNFLPEVRRSSLPRRWIVACVFAGVALIYAANLLLGKL
jgi:zinc transporter ZupT